MGGLQGGGKGDPQGESLVDTKGDRGVHMPPSGLHVQCGDMECPKEDLGGYPADHGGS